MRPVLVAACAVVLLALSGCGSSGNGKSESEREREKEGLGRAADTTTCVEKATAFSGTVPADYPKDFPLPRGAVLFDIEERGEDGSIGTAIVRATLKEVLDQLNGPAQQAGFEVTEGETEEHDAEANWEGNGFRGRWAIRDSSTCEGQVVIQVLAKKQ